jgi:hypothetical protein
MARVHFHVYSLVDGTNLYVGDDVEEAIRVHTEAGSEGIQLDVWERGKIQGPDKHQFAFMHGVRNARRYPPACNIDHMHKAMAREHPLLIHAEYVKINNVVVFTPVERPMSLQQSKLEPRTKGDIFLIGDRDFWLGTYRIDATVNEVDAHLKEFAKERENFKDVEQYLYMAFKGRIYEVPYNGAIKFDWSLAVEPSDDLHWHKGGNDE